MKTLGLRGRIIIVAAIFLLVTNLALGAVLMHQSREAMKTLIDERMLDVVNTATAMLDGDEVEKLTAEDEGTPIPRATPPGSRTIRGGPPPGITMSASTAQAIRMGWQESRFPNWLGSYP